MTDSQIMDKILSIVFSKPITNTLAISEDLDLPIYTINTLVRRMQDQLHVKTSILSEQKQAYIVTATDIGKHFYKTSSYKKESDQKLIENIPKRYWHVLAIVAYIPGLATPVIVDKLKLLFLPQAKTESIKEPLKTDSSAKYK